LRLETMRRSQTDLFSEGKPIATLMASIEKMTPLVIKQLADIRSSIVNEACATIVAMAVVSGEGFAATGRRIIPSLLSLLTAPIPTIAEASLRTVGVILGVAPRASFWGDDATGSVEAEGSAAAGMGMAEVVIKGCSATSQAARERFATVVAELAAVKVVGEKTLEALRSTCSPLSESSAGFAAAVVAINKAIASREVKSEENTDEKDRIEARAKAEAVHAALPKTPFRRAPRTPKPATPAAVAAAAATPTAALQAQALAPITPRVAQAIAAATPRSVKRTASRADDASVVAAAPTAAVAVASVEVATAPLVAAAVAPPQPTTATSATSPVRPIVKYTDQDVERVRSETLSQASQEMEILTVELQSAQIQVEEERRARADAERLACEFEKTIVEVVADSERAKVSLVEGEKAWAEREAVLVQEARALRLDYETLSVKFAEVKRAGQSAQADAERAREEVREAARAVAAGEERYATMKRAADDKMDAVATTIAQLRLEAKDNKAEMERLRAEAQAATKAAAEAEARRAAAEAEKTKAEASASALAKEAETLRGKVKVADAEASFLAAKNKELERLLKETQSSETRLQQDNAQLAATLRGLEAVRDQNAALEARAKSLEDETRRLKVDLYDKTHAAPADAALKAQLDDLRGQLEKKDKECKELTALCEEMVLQLENKQ
jgi:hypothetical protein